LNILITGGNGFLGSALAEKFYNLDFKINLLVRPESYLRRIQKNIDNYKIFKYSKELDIKNILIESNPDIIIHTACNYGRKNENILSIFDTNYRLGLILLNEIIIQQKKIIFLNIGTVLPLTTSLYAFSKNQFSELGKFITKSYSNIVFKNILLQHMYGPGDDENKFTSYVINSCLKNEQELLLTSGEQLRDFVYIKDVVEAIIIIIKKIYNCVNVDIEIGSGSLISIKEFVLKVHTLSNSNSKLNFGAIKNDKQLELPAAKLDLLYDLNWEPTYNIEEGLKETIKIEKK
jgi:nucleoside-diphosphate-sugar epimerase